MISNIDFLKAKHNSMAIAVAQRQQKQLAYFTQSSVQGELTFEYIRQWAERKYAGCDYFLTWIKMIFREENFLSFYKYMRFPLPSARLVNNNIKRQLKRVFTSEDSYSRYVISEKEVPIPEELTAYEFTKDLFDRLMFRHNDIIFHDLSDINKGKRYFVHIENVIAIDSRHNKINRIGFVAEVEINGEQVRGYLYADDKSYEFYNSDFEVLISESHDLGYCPAHYIAPEAFPNIEWDGYHNLYYHCDVIRKGIFSYVREDLEEYVFLKTLLKMTEPNGAIPVAVMLKTDEVDKSGKDLKGPSDMEPMSPFQVGSQRATFGSGVTPSDSLLQAGTTIKVPLLENVEGAVAADLTKNFITFYYMPVEALEYVKSRIEEIEECIIAAVLGDYSESDEGAKNEMQISKSYVSKEDVLRDLSRNLSDVRTASDTTMLELEHGPGRVKVEVFFGVDFFTESQQSLYEKLKISPNPIESKNLLQRLSRNRNMHNKEKGEREAILYELLPFANSTDFATALSQQIVQPEDVSLQTRFPYWIGRFEAEYGDILSFWNMMKEEKESIKIVLISNLIKQIINESKSIRDPESVQGAANGV